MIPRTRGNHSGTLGTARTSCDNFTNRKRHRGPVKVDGEIGEDRKIRGGNLRPFIRFQFKDVLGLAVTYVAELLQMKASLLSYPSQFLLQSKLFFIELFYDILRLFILFTR